MILGTALRRFLHNDDVVDNRATVKTEMGIGSCLAHINVRCTHVQRPSQLLRVTHAQTVKSKRDLKTGVKFNNKTCYHNLITYVIPIMLLLCYVMKFRILAMSQGDTPRSRTVVQTGVHKHLNTDTQDILLQRRRVMEAAMSFMSGEAVGGAGGRPAVDDKGNVALGAVDEAHGSFTGCSTLMFADGRVHPTR